MPAKHYFNVTELVKIYNLFQKGLTYNEIAQEMHSQYAQIKHAVERINDVFHGKKPHFKVYGQAAEKIASKPVIIPVTKEEIIPLDTPTPTADPFTLLDQAVKTYQQSFTEFQDAIFEFVKVMVDKQVGDIKKENEELKQIQEAAQHSNLVTNLKRHFTGKN